MEQRTRVILTFGVLIAIIAGIYFFTDWFSKATGYALGEDQKIVMAQCLAGSKAALYLTTNCADCERQRGILGENAYKIIKKITCDPSNLCGGLKSVPAWEIEGGFYYGVKSYKELDELSISCSIQRS